MQYPIMFNADSVYTQAVSYNRMYGVNTLPLSYLYKSIESAEIYNTEVFVSKFLVDTAFRHNSVEKFYSKKEREANVFDKGTFAFRFNVKYFFTEEHGEFASKTDNVRTFANDTKFAKAVVRPTRNYEQVFSSKVLETTPNDKNKFLWRGKYNYLIHNTALNLLDYKDVFSLDDVIADKNNIRDMIEQSIELSISNVNDVYLNQAPVYTSDSIERNLFINETVLVKEPHLILNDTEDYHLSRVAHNFNMNSSKLLSKSAGEVERKDEVSAYKYDGGLNVNNIKEMFKDTSGLYENVLFDVDTEDKELYSITNELASKLNNNSHIYNRVGARIDEKKIAYGYMESIGDITKELKVNDSMFISQKDKVLLTNRSINVSSIIRYAEINNSISAVTTKGGMVSDIGFQTVTQRNKGIVKNSIVPFNIEVKEVLNNIDIIFDLRSRESMSNNYIALNTSTKCSFTSDGIVYDTSYKGSWVNENVISSKHTSDVNVNSYKIISDLIKELYEYDFNMADKLVKDFKDTTSVGFTGIERNEDFELSVYNFDILNKRYKDMNEIETKILNKIEKDYKDFIGFEDIFIERNILTMRYGTVPTSILKAIKSLEIFKEINILKDLHNTYTQNIITINKPNIFGCGVNDDVIYQKNFKDTFSVDTIDVIKDIRDTKDDSNKIWFGRGLSYTGISNDALVEKASRLINLESDNFYNVVKSYNGAIVDNLTKYISQTIKPIFSYKDTWFVPDNKTITNTEEVFVHKISGGANVDNIYVGLSKSLDFGEIDTTINIDGTSKVTSINKSEQWYSKYRTMFEEDQTVNVIRNEKSSSYIRGVSATKEERVVSSISTFNMVDKDDKGLFEINDTAYFKFEKDVSIDNLDNVFLSKEYFDITSTNGVSISRESSNKVSIFDVKNFDKSMLDVFTLSNKYVNKIEHDFDRFNELDTLTKRIKDLGFGEISTFSKIQYDLSELTGSSVLDKILKYLEFHSDNVKLEKLKHYTNTFDNPINLDKALKVLGIEESSLNFSKIIKSLDTFISATVTKYIKDMSEPIKSVSISKDRHGSYICDSTLYNVMKDSLDVNDRTDMVGFGKGCSLGYGNNIVGYDTKEGSIYITDIVEYNKYNKNISIESDINKWVNRFKVADIVDTLIKIDCSTKDIDNKSVLIEYVKISGTVDVEDNNIGIGSSTFNTNIGDETVRIDASIKSTNVGDDVTYTTDTVDVVENQEVLLSQSANDSTVNEDCTLTKDTQSIGINSDVEINQRQNEMSIDDSVVSSKITKESSINESSVLNKGNHNVEENSNQIITNRDKLASSNEELVLKKAKIILNSDDYREIIEKEMKDNELASNSGFIISKLEHVVAHFPELERLLADRDLKEVYTECNQKWLSGDEHIKPDIRAGGIDELLLPGTDFDYTKFEDKVISSDGTPINPDKVIDARTFITSVPIKHPLPESSRIGIGYIDVNINMLRHMIEVTYKLWMKKAFKFGASDMREAMSILIDDLTAYVKLSIDGAMQENALRIIRLIRWYGEASINNNAKYKITVNYGELSSDLYEGECKIPHKFNNMYVDTNMYTITNMSVGFDCSADFFIANKVDTTVRMIVQVGKGEVVVSINNEEVDRLGVGMHKVEYELEKQDQDNVLNVFYNGSNNGIINLSNVVISDMCFEDYSMDYHAVRGTGNKVMDELIKYLSVYEDVLDHNKEYIEAVKDNNYPITELISNMLDYFELHHEKKNKGKRITTKR